MVFEYAKYNLKEYLMTLRLEADRYLIKVLLAYIDRNSSFRCYLVFKNTIKRSWHTEN